MTPDDRPNLSFCTLSDDPEATARVIDQLRGVVDEFVVAIDSRASDRIGALRGVHQLFVIDYRPPPERTFPWLYSRCRGRWRLRLDADEIPSRSLIHALDDLTAATDVTHYWIPRRWLYRNTETYLEDAPWFPDFQVRLVRNLPSVDAPPARVHELAPVAGAARYVEHAIYHADLLDTSLDARRRKANAYERARPGVRTDGLSVNAAYYLPELRKPRVATVPPDDRPLTALRAITRDAPESERRVQTMLTPVDPDEIERLWPGRDIAPTAYAARIELYGPIPALAAGLDRTMFLRVTNEGTETWPRAPTSLPEIRMGYRFRAADGTVLDEGRRGAFPAQMPPGGTSLVPLAVHAPDTAGEYELEIDVVHEHVRWFDATCRIPVTVAHPRRILIVAGYSPFRHAGDDAIVRAHLHRIAVTVPDVEPVLLATDPGPIAHRFSHQATRSMHHVLYDGIDTDLDVDELFPVVRARIDELVADASGFGSGAPAASEERRVMFGLIARADAVIFASGGSLASRYAVPELWPQMATALVANALGTRVVFSGVAVGPFHRAGDRELAGRAFDRAELIVVRDQEESAETLGECGVTHAEVVEEADVASALEPASAADLDDALEQVGLAPDARFVAVSVRADGELGALAALLDHTSAQHGLAVLFVPHCTNGLDDDREPMERLRKQLSPTVAVHAADPMPPDGIIKGLAGRATLAVGSRYHHVVFAAAAGVPSIALCGDDYACRRLQGAAAFAPGLVAIIPTDGPAVELIATADQLLQAGPGRPSRPSELRALSALFP